MTDDDKLTAATEPGARLVRCPRCGGDSVYAASNPARPFCSVRCKDIDFGDWSSEAFRMPAPVTSEDQDDAADSLPH